MMVGELLQAKEKQLSIIGRLPSECLLAPSQTLEKKSISARRGDLTVSIQI